MRSRRTRRNATDEATSDSKPSSLRDPRGFRTAGNLRVESRRSIGVRAGLAPTGNFKCSAVVRAGPRERQSQRDVHAGIERVKLQRDQSLIVIHAEHAVEFAADRSMKNGIGRNGTGESCVCRRSKVQPAVTAGSITSNSSQPSTPDSPACGFNPATATRARPSVCLKSARVNCRRGQSRKSTVALPRP